LLFHLELLARLRVFDLLQQMFHSFLTEILVMCDCMFLVIFTAREVSVAAGNFAEESHLLVNRKQVAVEIVLS
jgi:hypothetical protein